MSLLRRIILGILLIFAIVLFVLILREQSVYPPDETAQYLFLFFCMPAVILNMIEYDDEARENLYSSKPFRAGL